MLDKEKGPILGKLRTIQLIEADFQHLMRLFIRTRDIGKLERNVNISKFNFSSRI